MLLNKKRKQRNYLQTKNYFISNGPAYFWIKANNSYYYNFYIYVFVFVFCLCQWRIQGGGPGAWAPPPPRNA